MKKSTHFLFLFSIILISSVSITNAQISESEANDSIRGILTSGIYTSGNLNVNFDTSNLNSRIKFEYGKEVKNLIEFKTGNSIFNPDTNLVDRVAFLTYNVEVNFATLYTVETVCSAITERSRSKNYMNIYSFDEDIFGSNVDIEEDEFDINYKDISCSILTNLGYNGKIPIDISFDTSDFVPSNTLLEDGSTFETLGLYADIDSVSVYDTELSFLDSGGNIYQTTPSDLMSSNKVSDMNSVSYKNEEDAPYDFKAMSEKIEDAGLTGTTSTSYKTTLGDTGHRAIIYCQNGELDLISNKYQLDIQLEPQVQVKQEQLQYKQMNSATTDFHSAGRWIYIDRDDELESIESRHATAYLSNEYITRTIGVEVYNVNIHADLKVVVKMLASTNFTQYIDETTVSDSNIEEQINSVQGDMYWDNALSQDVGSFIFDTSTFWDKIERALGFDLSSILWIGAGIIFLIFVLPAIAPIITAIISNRSRRR